MPTDGLPSVGSYPAVQVSYDPARLDHLLDTVGQVTGGLRAQARSFIDQALASCKGTLERCQQDAKNFISQKIGEGRAAHTNLVGDAQARADTRLALSMAILQEFGIDPTTSLSPLAPAAAPLAPPGPIVTLSPPQVPPGGWIPNYACQPVVGPTVTPRGNPIPPSGKAICAGAGGFTPTAGAVAWEWGMPIDNRGPYELLPNGTAHFYWSDGYGTAPFGSPQPPTPPQPPGPIIPTQPPTGKPPVPPVGVYPPVTGPMPPIPPPGPYVPGGPPIPTQPPPPTPPAGPQAPPCPPPVINLSCPPAPTPGPTVVAGDGNVSIVCGEQAYLESAAGQAWREHMQRINPTGYALLTTMQLDEHTLDPLLYQLYPELRNGRVG